MPCGTSAVDVLAEPEQKPEIAKIGLEQEAVAAAPERLAAGGNESLELPATFGIHVVDDPNAGPVELPAQAPPEQLSQDTLPWSAAAPDAPCDTPQNMQIEPPATQDQPLEEIARSSRTLTREASAVSYPSTCFEDLTDCELDVAQPSPKRQDAELPADIVSVPDSDPVSALFRPSAQMKFGSHSSRC